MANHLESSQNLEKWTSPVASERLNLVSITSEIKADTRDSLKGAGIAKTPEPKAMVMESPYPRESAAICRAPQHLYQPGDHATKAASSNRLDNSPRAEAWRKDAAQQAKRPVTPDSDGKYEVHKGDSLWGITKRLMESEGQKKCTPEQFNKKLKELIDLNKDRYPTLECNPGLIKPGMKLKLKPDMAEQPKKPEVQVEQPKLPQVQIDQVKPLDQTSLPKFTQLNDTDWQYTLSSRMSTMPWSAEYLSTGRVTPESLDQRIELRENLRPNYSNGTVSMEEADKAKHLANHNMFVDQLYFLY